MSLAGGIFIFAFSGLRPLGVLGSFVVFSLFLVVSSLFCLSGHVRPRQGREVWEGVRPSGQQSRGGP